MWGNLVRFLGPLPYSSSPVTIFFLADAGRLGSLRFDLENKVYHGCSVITSDCTDIIRDCLEINLNEVTVKVGRGSVFLIETIFHYWRGPSVYREWLLAMLER